VQAGDLLGVVGRAVPARGQAAADFQGRLRLAHALAQQGPGRQQGSVRCGHTKQRIGFFRVSQVFIAGRHIEDLRFL
jgi:hypothetical protein